MTTTMTLSLTEATDHADRLYAQAKDGHYGALTLLGQLAWTTDDARTQAVYQAAYNKVQEILDAKAEQATEEPTTPTDPTPTVKGDESFDLTGLAGRTVETVAVVETDVTGEWTLEGMQAMLATMTEETPQAVQAEATEAPTPQAGVFGEAVLEAAEATMAEATDPNVPLALEGEAGLYADALAGQVTFDDINDHYADVLEAVKATPKAELVGWGLTNGLNGCKPWSKKQIVGWLKTRAIGALATHQRIQF